MNLTQIALEATSAPPNYMTRNIIYGLVTSIALTSKEPCCFIAYTGRV